MRRSRKRESNSNNCNNFVVPQVCQYLSSLPILQCEQDIPCELDIHPKKLDEVRGWFASFASSACTPFCTNVPPLVVVGPSGSGKKTCIRWLCKEFRISLVPWECEEFHDDGWSPTSEGAEMKSLGDFIKGPVAGIEIGQSDRIIKLVHYLPTTAYSQTIAFQDFLIEWLSENKTPLIFCLAECCSYDFSPRKIFSPSFCEEFNVSLVVFNAVATSFLRKALRRKIRSYPILNSKQADALVKTIEVYCNGDLRCALNMLIFSFENRIRKGAKLCEQLEGTPSYNLFHMIGRIMYAKRLDESIELDERDVSQELRRPVSVHDTNFILDMAQAQASTVVSFIHEHEPHFAPSISALAKIYDNLSCADSLSKRWELRFHTEEAISQIASRSAIFYNFYPSSSDKILQRGQYMFSRPVYSELERTMQCVKEEIMTRCEVRMDTTCTLPFLPFTNFCDSSPQQAINCYLARPFRSSWWECSFQTFLADYSRRCSTSETVSASTVDDINIYDSEEELDLFDDSFD